MPLKNNRGAAGEEDWGAVRSSQQTAPGTHGLATGKPPQDPRNADLGEQAPVRPATVRGSRKTQKPSPCPATAGLEQDGSKNGNLHVVTQGKGPDTPRLAGTT